MVCCLRYDYVLLLLLLFEFSYYCFYFIIDWLKHRHTGVPLNFWNIHLKLLAIKLAYKQLNCGQISGLAEVQSLNIMIILCAVESRSRKKISLNDEMFCGSVGQTENPGKSIFLISYACQIWHHPVSTSINI